MGISKGEQLRDRIRLLDGHSAFGFGCEFSSLGGRFTIVGERMKQEGPSGV